MDHGSPSLLSKQHNIRYVSSLCPLITAYNGNDDIAEVEKCISVAEACVFRKKHDAE